MKKTVFAAAFIALAATTAQACETGVINQAGAYESTMQFYLHPAQGFPGAPRATPQSIAADEPSNVDAKQPLKRIASAHVSYRTKTRDTYDTQTTAK